MSETNSHQPRVIVFSTPTCVYCNAVKKYFLKKNIHFRDVDVSKDPTGLSADGMRRRFGAHA